MHNARKASHPWIIATVTVMAMWLLLTQYTHIHYDLNDDMILTRAFAGASGGVREHFNYYTHPLLGWLMVALQSILPSVAWFSVLQISLLSIAAVSITQAALCATTQATWRLPLAWLFAAGCLVLTCMEFSTSITYTTTAAVLGTAGVWRALTVPLQPSTKQTVRGFIGSFGWIVLAYLLRMASVWPLLCFWIGALLCRALLIPLQPQSVIVDDPAVTPPTNQSLKPAKIGLRAPLQAALLAIGIALLLLACLFGVQAVDRTLSGEQPYSDWQQARMAAIDYGSLARADQATLAQVHWSKTERAIALNWYFMDGNMNVTALQQLSTAPRHLSLGQALQAITALWARNRNTFWVSMLLGALCGSTLLLSAVRKVRSGWVYVAPLGVVAVTATGLLYLATQGRLPMRAGMTLLLPAVALLSWLLLQAITLPSAMDSPLLPISQTPKRLAATQHPSPTAHALKTNRSLLTRLASVAVIVVCVSVAFFGQRNGWHNIYRAAQAQSASAPSRYAQLETYALAHPEQLFVAENALGMESALFPPWYQGMATNLLYNWGSWNNHSAGYRALLSQFGFSATQFSIVDFIDRPLRLVTVSQQPPTVFIAYLQERYGLPYHTVVEVIGDGYYVLAFVSGDAT